MMELYLIRHGQTLWNQDKKYQGHQDVPLSQSGKQQARALARWLRPVELDAVYASDLSRALDTAKEIARERGIKVQVDKRFREINFGHWEGRTFNEIKKIYPDLVAQWIADPSQVQLPGGEDFVTVKKRSYKAVQEIVEEHNYSGRVAVVSHGATIRTILCSVLDLPLKAMWQMEQGNTAVNIIKFPKDYPPIVALVNSTCHLDQACYGSF
ncbi:MAG: alpha-ribazole phosphatase [Thermoanaerobacteraceae bacterium]|nr:alpha-ribazole phosphatase [Thermoanaerobacteraceae bacterium]